MEVTLHLDTDAYSSFMRGRQESIAVIERAAALAVSPVVIGELKGGFALGTRESRNLELLREFLVNPRVSVPPLDDQVTDNYALIYKDLRRTGLPIPTNDLWIAACAYGEESALFTLDRHFDAIKGLKVVHGLKDLAAL